MKPNTVEHFVEFLKVMYPNGARFNKMVGRAHATYKAAMEYLGPGDTITMSCHPHVIVRKIEAIKTVREAYGWGLKEAKDAVDSMNDGQPFTFQGTAEQAGRMLKLCQERHPEIRQVV